MAKHNGWKITTALLAAVTAALLIAVIAVSVSIYKKDTRTQIIEKGFTNCYLAAKYYELAANDLVGYETNRSNGHDDIAQKYLDQWQKDYSKAKTELCVTHDES